MSNKPRKSAQTGSKLIASEKIQIERKFFYLDLMENHRGRFVKIMEEIDGRQNTIMLSTAGFHKFIQALLTLEKFAAPPEQEDSSC